LNAKDKRQLEEAKKTIQLVPRGLVVLAMSAVIPDEALHLRPCVFTPDESQCMVLSKMAREYVIMPML
jgi:hypothetical protein